MEKKQPLMSKFKPQKALFTTFPCAKPMGKENHPQPIYPAPPNLYSDSYATNNFSLEGLYGQRQPPKRALLEAAPINESRPLKKAKTDEGNEGEDSAELQEIPAPDSFPILLDDGTKPGHSYAQLIGMSILRAPHRRLTLAQIYKWISDTFSFYNPADAGWQNSIRHNLSLNKAFIKQERPKDDPGKGNYWAIQPGMERQFVRDKSGRKSAASMENVPVLSANFVPSHQAESSQLSFKTLTPAPQELPPPQPVYAYSEPQSSAIPEFSSDATIPASDALVPEVDAEKEEGDGRPSSPLPQSSPPTPMMRSSPPVPRHMPRRHDTPPPVPRFPSSSRSRSHKRKFASMDDSGYFSSLESSALRPQRLLTSDADRPRIKRGRAEEEIARMRGSSYDSPTKGRASFVPPSSSPLRRGMATQSSQMLPPLTPAIKLKAPVKPPPSASPNTNLRQHRDKVRQMVGSPLRGLVCLDENLPWSPAFNLDESYPLQNLDTEFDIFADVGTGMLSASGNSSPEKKSAKRPRLDRSRSANILADITNSSLKKNITSASMKYTPYLEPLGFDSPFRGLGFMESPSELLGITSPSKVPSSSFCDNFDLPQEDFYGAEFLADELDDFSGMDIMQGFQKIGAGGQSARTTPQTTGSRPTFGRSVTTRF